MARPPKTNVTIKDVAREAGVSIASVSFALNNSGSVSAAVRARVLETVERLGYRRNQLAKTMRTGKSKTLGLLLPDLCNPFFPELAHAIGDAARLAGYAVMLVESNNGKDERDGIEQLVTHQVDGLCWCPSSRRDYAEELGVSIPVVVIDRPLPRRDVIISDYAMGADLLARHLLDQNYQSVGLIAGPADYPGTAQRTGGLVTALDGRLPIAWQHENPYSLELSPEILEALKRNEARVIACGNDTIAIAVVRALAELRLRVPEDVAVVGFDDIPWATLIDPPLTTIRQHLPVIGAEAISVLIGRIENPDTPARQVQIEVDLVKRKSS